MLSLVMDVQKSQSLKISLDFSNNCVNKEELSKISLQLMQKALLYEAFLYKIYAKVLEMESLVPELKIESRKAAISGDERALQSPSFSQDAKLEATNDEKDAAGGRLADHDGGKEVNPARSNTM